MPSGPPETVLFDLDSTLCRSTQDAETIHAEAFERVGIEPFCEVRAIRETAPEIGRTESEFEFFRRVFDRVAAERGVGPVDAAALARATIDLTDATAVQWRPGAQAALTLARERATVGLVTNGSRETQQTKLRALGIESAFETAVYAGSESEPKPSPAPFETALADLGAEPDDTLYVGNDYRADVVGAKRAGLSACWVPGEHDPSAPERPRYEPDATLETPADLDTLL